MSFMFSIIFSILSLSVISNGIEFNNPIYEIAMGKEDIIYASVVKNGDTYYMVTDENSNFVMQTSKTLTDWQVVPEAFQELELANETISHGALFFTLDNATRLFYSLGEEISVAFASRVEGPYHPLCYPVLHNAINGTHAFPFQVEETAYLYFTSGSEIIVAVLALPDFTNIDLNISADVVLSVTQDWEKPLVKHPIVIKHEEFFYLFFSGGEICSNSRGVSVARSDNVTGPFDKYGARLELAENDCDDVIGEFSVVQETSGDWVIIYQLFEHNDGVCKSKGLFAKSLTWGVHQFPLVGEIIEAVYEEELVTTLTPMMPITEIPKIDTRRLLRRRSRFG